MATAAFLRKLGALALKFDVHVGDAAPLRPSKPSKLSKLSKPSKLSLR